MDRPAGRIALLNAGIALGLFVAYRHGQRGLDLLFLSMASVIVLNAIGAVGILLGRKIASPAPNKFLKPLWIAAGILWLIYILDYLLPGK